MFRGTDGNWYDETGINTASYPMDEVTVMPGEFKEQNGYANKLRDDYSQALFNYNKANNPKT